MYYQWQGSEEKCCSRHKLWREEDSTIDGGYREADDLLHKPEHVEYRLYHMPSSSPSAEQLFFRKLDRSMLSGLEPV